jgi:hypothetical protein
MMSDWRGAIGSLIDIPLTLLLLPIIAPNRKTPTEDWVRICFNCFSIDLRFFSYDSPLGNKHRETFQ